MLEAAQGVPGSTFPLPLCAACALQDECVARGAPFDDYPECRRPLRSTSLARQAALLSWCDRGQGGPDERLAAVDARILDRFASDRNRYSEIFEPSVSRDGAGWHLRRYSYAFPGYRDDPAGVRDAVASLASPFGENFESWFAGTLARAADRAVDEVLFGVAWESASEWRLKLYLQFADGDRNAALGAAARVLSFPALRERFAGERLHLLGLDVGPAGLGAVKLYLEGEVSAIPWLEGLGPIRKALRIFRLAPGRRLPDDPVEVDFPLAENGLLFDDVARLAPVRAVVDGADPLSALGREFRIAVRRVSVSVPSPGKFTAYFVLTETDAP